MPTKKPATHNAHFIHETEYERLIIAGATSFKINILTRTCKEVETVASLTEAIRRVRLAAAAFGDVRCLVYAMAEVAGIERGALAFTYDSRRKAFKCVESLAAKMAEAVDAE